MIYQVVGDYRRQYPGISMVRHEDLSLAPLEGFRDLYARLDLDYNSRAIKAIEGSSGVENPVELSPDRVHGVKLNSQSNLANWKRRLSTSEVERIYKLTQDVAVNYYSDDEWN
jgi:hypothetical protein